MNHTESWKDLVWSGPDSYSEWWHQSRRDTWFMFWSVWNPIQQLKQQQDYNVIFNKNITRSSRFSWCKEARWSLIWHDGILCHDSPTPHTKVILLCKNRRSSPDRCKGKVHLNYGESLATTDTSTCKKIVFRALQYQHIQHDCVQGFANTTRKSCLSIGNK